MKRLTIGTLFLAAVVMATTGVTPALADHPTAQVSIIGGVTPDEACVADKTCFSPFNISVDVGGEVTWTNDDTTMHTVDGGSLEEIDPDGPSAILMVGDEYSFKYEEAGEFPYFCQVHPWMDGIVTVAEEGEHHRGEMHDDDMMKMGMMVEGVLAKLKTEGMMAGSPMEITVTLTDENDMMLEHTNIRVMAMQDGETILDKEYHDHGGMHTDIETAPLLRDATDSPVDITVELLGLGVDMQNLQGPMGQVATVQIVPEFGAIAIAILAVAVVSIVAITAKSKLAIRV